MASRAAELAKKSGFEGTQAKISHLLGDVNALLNPTQLVQNQRYYLDSLRLAKKLGMLPLIAHCHLGLGRSHLNAGNYKDANLQLKDATNLYRKLNMNFWLSQAQAAPGNTV